MAVKERHDSRVHLMAPLPSLIPLLRSAELIVKDHDALGGPRQVGDDEPDARVKLARVPLNLRHYPATFLPALCLISEAGIVAARLVRRSPDWAPEQVSDLVLQDAIGRQPDRVADALRFEELVHFGIGESRVAAKIELLAGASVSGDHRFQHRAPAVGAVDLPRAQGAALDIPELVEQEQRVIAGAAEMAVVRAAFLFAVGWAFARIHVEHDGSRPTAGMRLVDPTGLADQPEPRGSRAGSATSSQSGPSGWQTPQTRRSPDRRPPSALPGRGTAGRRRSRPRNQPAVQKPIGAAGHTAGAARSCRCAHRQAYRHPSRLDSARHPTHDRPAARIGRVHGAAKLQQQAAVEIEPQRTPIPFTRSAIPAPS